MRYVEVMGAPGVGKSTLTNDRWPPAVEWDGHPPPAEWAGFLRLVEAQAGAILPGCGADDWRRMFEKALRKAATLHRRASAEVYAGVALAQRGLDLAWRVGETVRIADYFEAMPVSHGVAILRADVATIVARNIERGRRQPSRQLARLAPLLAQPIEIAAATLKRRGVRLLELDTREPVSANAARLTLFVRAPEAAHPEAARHRREVAPVPAPGDGARP